MGGRSTLHRSAVKSIPMPLKKRVPIDLSMPEWTELALKFPRRSMASILREIHDIGKAVLFARIANEKKESV